MPVRVSKKIEKNFVYRLVWRHLFDIVYRKKTAVVEMTSRRAELFGAVTFTERYFVLFFLKFYFFSIFIIMNYNFKMDCKLLLIES